MISSKRGNVIIVAAGTGRVPLGDGGARTESCYQMVISVGLGEAGNSCKWEKLHLAIRLKWQFYSDMRTDPRWSREGSSDYLLGQECCIWWSGEILPTLSNSEVCVESSADRFESTMCKVLAALLLSCSCIPQTALPSIIIHFLGFAELSLSASKLSPAKMSLPEGAARRKSLAVVSDLPQHFI